MQLCNKISFGYLGKFANNRDFLKILQNRDLFM